MYSVSMSEFGGRERRDAVYWPSPGLYHENDREAAKARQAAAKYEERLSRSRKSSPVPERPEEFYRKVMQWRWWLLTVVMTLVAAGFGAAVWLDGRYELQKSAEQRSAVHSSDIEEQREAIKAMRHDIQDLKVITARIAVEQRNLADRLELQEYRSNNSPGAREIRKRIKRREEMAIHDPVRALNVK